MLEGIDYERFVKFSKEVELLNLRFPIADIVKQTGFDKGYVSKVLKGKKPLSDNFLKVFYEKYNVPEVALTEHNEVKQAIDIAELKATVDLLVGYVLQLRAEKPDATILKVTKQYEKDLRQQLNQSKKQ